MPCVTAISNISFGRNLEVPGMVLRSLYIATQYTDSIVAIGGNFVTMWRWRGSGFVCEAGTSSNRLPLVFASTQPADQTLESPDRCELAKAKIFENGDEIQEH